MRSNGGGKRNRNKREEEEKGVYLPYPPAVGLQAVGRRGSEEKGCGEKRQ